MSKRERSLDLPILAPEQNTPKHPPEADPRAQEHRDPWRLAVQDQIDTYWLKVLEIHTELQQSPPSSSNHYMQSLLRIIELSQRAAGMEEALALIQSSAFEPNPEAPK